MDTDQDITEVLRTEVAAEADDGHLSIEVIDGLTVRVPPAGQWRQSANDALNSGAFNTWASSVLTSADAQAWIDADLTNDEVTAFFRAWAAETGVGLGGSRASRRSSARTARR